MGKNVSPGVKAPKLFNAHHMNRTAYVSGKMGKNPVTTLKERYKALEDTLKPQGFVSFAYSSKMDIPDITREESLKQDIVRMLSCDILYLDNNWHSSKRCMTLRDVAMKVGMDVMYRH